MCIQSIEYVTHETMIHATAGHETLVHHLYCIHKQNDLGEHRLYCIHKQNYPRDERNSSNQILARRIDNINLLVCVRVSSVVFINSHVTQYTLTHSHSHKENILSLLIRRWAERLALSVPTCMIERHEDIQNNIYYTAWSNKST